MFLRIDPSFPVVWRDDTTAQIGIDPIVSTLAVTEARVARGLAELVRGTSASRLTSVVGGETEANALLDACGDAFVRLPLPEPPRVVVIGNGVGADTVAHVWSHASSALVRARSSRDVPGTECDVAILVSDFVVSPVDVQPWLGRDIPHLGVVFGESSVTVGPLVRPGVTACIRCVELHRVDDDPAWSAMAPQLWGRVAAASASVLATHAAAETLRLVGDEPGQSVRVDARTLKRAATSHSLHPDCGCRVIPARRE
ncbi:MAG: hypothetical protein RLZZ319_352 [Actinomycetota bacterium]